MEEDGARLLHGKRRAIGGRHAGIQNRLEIGSAGAKETFFGSGAVGKWRRPGVTGLVPAPRHQDAMNVPAGATTMDPLPPHHHGTDHGEESDQDEESRDGGRKP